MSQPPSRSKKVILALCLTISILLLPFATVLWALTFTNDSYPLGQVLAGFSIGIFAAILAVIITISLWIYKQWKYLLVITVLLAVINVGWLPVNLGYNHLTRPYTRNELLFSKIQPPEYDATGKWQGYWRNPKIEYSESITLELIQSDGVVEGKISTDTGRNYAIVDGIVSGNKINLSYTHSFPDWPHPGLVGTLIAEINDNEMEGTWYAHERPPRGLSREGPWKAKFIVDSTAPEESN